MIIYTVKPGDTLYSIAKEFGVTLSELERFNALPDNSRISVGQDVLIPIEGDIYTVQSGDSLYNIASHFGITVQQLLNVNPDINPPFIIYPGQIINLPDTIQKRTISVNGYCYPNISADILAKTLPYLTYLSIFSHSVNADGSLNMLDDSDLISTARNNRVSPIMVITNTEEGSGFSSELANNILSNPTTRTTLINNVINTAANKGYGGVDVDFEYIFPKDRENYNTFLSELRAALEPKGLTLSTAIAPKLSATQQGTLYEAHDYAFHGSIVDYLIIMTYEWGYLYGPPLAVAPYSEVKKVISYAVTEIPSEKILMGMPNYAYDWTLPYQQGRPAEILSINQAILRAADTGSVIQYNEKSEAPFFEYTRNGSQHIVWFENARSTKARLELINDYNLGGLSYWTINQFYAQNWQVVSSMFNIRKVL